MENGNRDMCFYVVPISMKHDVTFNEMKFHLLSSVLNEMVAHEGLYESETALILRGLDRCVECIVCFFCLLCLGELMSFLVNSHLRFFSQQHSFKFIGVGLLLAA